MGLKLFLVTIFQGDIHQELPPKNPNHYPDVAVPQQGVCSTTPSELLQCVIELQRRQAENIRSQDLDLY